MLSSTARGIARASVRSAMKCNAAPKGRWASMMTIPARPAAQMTSPLMPLQSILMYRPYSATPVAADQVETLSFQAETRKLLDIVTNSIYTDKDVFLRELISNASDALEKFRYSQVKGVTRSEPGAETAHLNINILTDAAANTITLIDNGIGMSREELISNLGTIARSGSKQFVESQTGESSSSTRENIIGQFGVGFYSAFMVSDRVTFESISALGDTKSAHRWTSAGTGEFTIESVDPESLREKLPLGHGSVLTLYLKESAKEFGEAEKLRTIIKHYSAFVSFPVSVDNAVVNTVPALWSRDKKEVTEAEYKDFYKFLSGAYDEPRYRLHFRTDAPLDLKVLLFVPMFHTEKFGMGTMAPGVNLYSRRVLIESKPKDLLPDWLRFVKGAVDSEDLPLSLSREKPQDSALLRRIRDALTRRLLKLFEEQKKNDFEKYVEFYIEYQVFLKQGACQDYAYMEQLSKLLLFDSTNSAKGAVVSLDDYISRCPPEQKQIYYLCAPSREAALSSPYLEAFLPSADNKDAPPREVLLLYNTIDEFVMGNLRTFSGRTLVSVENSTQLEQQQTPPAEKAAETSADSAQKLTETEVTELCAWLRITLGDRVREVKPTQRLRDSPAVVTDHESGALRRMLKMVEQANNRETNARDLPPQVLEIHGQHPLMQRLFRNRENPAAAVVAEQLFDNALVAAGLLEDPRSMLKRLNAIMLHSLESPAK